MPREDPASVDVDCAPPRSLRKESLVSQETQDHGLVREHS